jgi:RNA polymerase sigma factor (sigma-70 family)
MNMQPDQALIRGCKEGDKDAFDGIYSRYSSVMYGICLRYARDREEAQDLLQEGFIRVYERIHQYSGEGSFEGWMRRLFVNMALDVYKKKKRESEQVLAFAAEMVPEEDDNPWPAVSEKELVEMIRQLPEGYRMVFNLFAVEGFSHKQIAAQLGISESTSKTQFFKARKQLRQQVEALVRKTSDLR